MVVRVLFWNLNGKDLRPLVCRAAAAEQAAVVILLESKATVDDTLADLQSRVSDEFRSPDAAFGRFHLFSREPPLDLREVYSGNRISLRRLRYSGTELLLGIVHVVDKLNWDEAHQSSEVQLLAAEVYRQEASVGNHRTILVGDFNMNPFDQAMNMAAGMNAMMTTECVKRGKRTVQSRDYPFFYNPMWGLFGDRTPGPAGTYYRGIASRGAYGWNMLDQVLVRPEALLWFQGVRILTSAGDTTLTGAAGRPNADVASDHLPILLALK